MRTFAALFTALALAGCATPRTAPAPASTSGTEAAAAPAAQTDQWEEELSAFDAADRQNPPPPGGVVFAGSSSIRMWEDLAEDFPGVPVLNRGFGGSQTSDLLRHLDRVVLRYRPRLVLIYEGDNDLNAGKSPEEVLADFRAVVERIHRELPETRIGFISIKPSPSRWELEPKMREANDLVRSYTETDPLLFYVDVHTPMLGADGRPRPELYREDQLHMTRAGYEIWREAIGRYVR
jgi:lysophospholipase L1-like esterase